jgi:hypothetical protein
MNPSHGMTMNSDQFDNDDASLSVLGQRNRQLTEVIEFYDCADLLPYAYHIMWLAEAREALGYLPFSLDYFDIRCLVILKEEVNKKQVRDMQQSSREQESALSKARHVRH